ncbi:hypothetical protein IAT38_000933 [Cryptococcus sp. DSM 104549]
MPATGNSPASQLADPLVALGGSTTLHIVSYLPLADILSCTLMSHSWHRFIESDHRTSIYRRLAREVGVPPREIKALIQLENARPARDGDVQTSVRPGQERKSHVDWKATATSERVVLQNWKKGRADLRWMPLGGNEVWRIKPDSEQGVMYSTGTIDGEGVLVSDIETNQPLFQYACPVAAIDSHLEFARGHVVFDVEPSNAIEVHLTPLALQRLTPAQRRALPDPSESRTYRQGQTLPSRVAYSQPAPASADIPPRGHLTYSKTIRPPTSCMAFRARVDKEDQEGERVVLATAGEEAVYIWGLDDNDCERYIIPIENRVELTYVEFDDNYIFLCGADQMHTISRTTKERLLTFSGSNALPAFPDPSAIYYLLPDNTAKKVSSERRYAALALQHAMDGAMKGSWNWSGVKKVVDTWEHPAWGFSACHYTSNDLFCTNRSGFVYVLRDYKMVLAITDKVKRDKAASERLLILLFTSSVMQLATYRESVVFNTGSMVYLLHTSDLPATPFNTTPEAPNPTMRIIRLADVSAPGLRGSSCLQMDRGKLYIVYSASGDLDVAFTEFEGTHYDGLLRPEPPDSALEGGAVCVMAWEFDTTLPSDW